MRLLTYYMLFTEQVTPLVIDLDACFAEVHASNMSKLDENGVPIYREDGKVLKGPNFFAPDLRKALWLD